MAVSELIARGVALALAGRHGDALAAYDEALTHDPESAEAHYNRGAALQALSRLPDALASYRRALLVTPVHVQALNNGGVVLKALGRLNEAAAFFERAVALAPDDVVARINGAVVLQDLGRLSDALAAYEAALARAPQTHYLAGRRMFCKAMACDWRDFDAGLAQLAEAIERGASVALPFMALGLLDAPALQRHAAETFVRLHHPGRAAPLPRQAREGKLRLGYFSADFRSHAVSHLLAGVIEAHDRARFEVTGFSFGPPAQDAMRARMERAFDRFVDLSALSAQAAADEARKLGIDIAIDLSGHTLHSRPDIFAHRAAPIQIGWLGYPGTSGALYFDALFADRVVIPEAEHANYTERVVYLPECYLPRDTAAELAPAPSRAELGLPEEGFVFASFNNTAKFTPAMLDVWMRLLRAVDGSVLWLAQANPEAAENLRREAAARGVDPARLIFAPRMPTEQHLARQACADLMLDTAPYNGHTTTSDALWAGVPVVTLRGAAFAGRVSTSLLTAVGLEELAVDTLEAYEALALTLAHDGAARGALRAKLAAARGAFDTARFTRGLETALLNL